eukprot:g36196.t1
MDNLTMLHFSSFYPKHMKTAIPFGQVFHIHRICLDEEEDEPVKVEKDTLNGSGYDAQLIDRQFRHHWSQQTTSLQDNIDHNNIQACHGNFCKVCQIIDMDTTIARKDDPEAWYIGETMQTLQKQMNGHHTAITRQECSLSVGEHFSVKEIWPWIFGVEMAVRAVVCSSCQMWEIRDQSSVPDNYICSKSDQLQLLTDHVVQLEKQLDAVWVLTVSERVQEILKQEGKQTEVIVHIGTSDI